MRRKTYHPAGTAPGTLVAPAGARTDVSVQVIDYRNDHFQERKLATIDECMQFATRTR
jgi:hypothetical protein